MSSVKNTTSVNNNKQALQNSATATADKTSNNSGSIFENKIDVSDFKKGAMGTQKDKDIVAQLNDEFGVRKGGGNRLDWEKLMQSGDSRIAIYDSKTGERIDPNKAEKIAAGEKGAGMIKGGYIMEVKSKNGIYKIQVGGDGEINGRDDVVLKGGNEAAAQAVTSGMNNISNNMNAAGAKASQQTSPTAIPGMMALTYPAFNYDNQYSSPFAYAFSNQEIRNLIAAMLQSINQN